MPIVINKLILGIRIITWEVLENSELWVLYFLVYFWNSYFFQRPREIVRAKLLL